MASAPQAHLCRAVGAAPLPLAQRRAAIAHILAQPGSAADPPVLAALAVEWVQSGNDVLAADLLNHIAAKSHALPSIASLLDRKPPLAVPHLLTVFLHLFSAREKANTGSSLADQCTVSEGLGPILNDSKLAPEAQAALARLLLHHPACRPTGVDLITRATIWLTLVQLDTHFNEYANAFVSLIVSEWGDRMEKVMVALNRLFAIVASEDATPSPALAFLLSAVPPGFISFASEHVTAARDISDAQILLAMQRISSWPLTERIAAWLLALVRGLRTAGRREVLASFATQNAAAVCVQLGSRALVATALPVVESVLLGYQETAVPFLSTLPRLLPMLVNVSLDAKSEKCLEVNYAVCEEIRQLHNGERAPALLTEAEAKQLSEILWAGIFRHPGHPEVYAPLVSALERFARPADDQLKARLVAADWLLSGSASGGAAGDVEVRGRGADGVGLVNCGNTCYAAVIMQSLFHTEPFRAAVFALQPAPARKTVAHELQRLFAFLALTHRAAHVPQHLLDVLPAQFRAGTQQDASELSKFMLDRLDTELKPSPGRTTVSDAFGGRIANVVRCSDCKAESVREEDMLDLTLSLPENGDTAPLEKLLETAWAPEQLTGEARYRCDACGGLRDAERRTMLVKAPHHLIVTLNRFAYDAKTGRRTKLLSDVPYPETLLVPVAGAPVGYALYAVVLHSGLSPEHGHYYAYARPSASGTAQTWRRFNDSDVAPSTFADFSAITRAFRSDVPYLLFYRRLDEPPVDAAAPVRFDVPGALQEQVAADNRRFVEEQQRDQRRRHLQRAAHVSQRYHYDDPGAGGPPPFCKDNFGPGNSGAGGGWNRDVF